MLKELFSGPIGAVSLATIVGVICDRRLPVIVRHGEDGRRRGGREQP
jgi:hypothetical protein